MSAMEAPQKTKLVLREWLDLFGLIIIFFAEALKLLNKSKEARLVT